MPEKPKLSVKPRKIVGRKVKSLRREGIVPATVYGKKIKSLSLEFDLKEFLPLYQKLGETGVFDLAVEGEEKTRPVLIHQVQLQPVRDEVLHVDFYQVDLKQKVTVAIPVELKGEPTVVAQNMGILIQPINEVEVEALPGDLPEKFTVDVSKLAEVGQALSVADLKVVPGVKVLTEATQILAKIEPLAAEEVVTPPEEVPAEGAEEAAAPGAEAEKVPEATEEKQDQ